MKLPDAWVLGRMQEKEVREPSVLTVEWEEGLLGSPLQARSYNSSKNNSNTLHSSKHFRGIRSFNDHNNFMRKLNLKEVNNLSEVELISGRAGLQARQPCSRIPNCW